MVLYSAVFGWMSGARGAVRIHAKNDRDQATTILRDGMIAMRSSFSPAVTSVAVRGREERMGEWQGLDEER